MDTVRETAISSLINARSQALRISRAELVARCGFKNIAKGIRRLEQVCEGDFSRTRPLLIRLPDALSLEPHVVNAAVVATEQAKLREEEQRCRDAFRPHAILICERQVPEPIWVASVIGIDRILRIDFQNGSVPVSYLKQALNGIKDKQRRWCSTALPAFGRPTAIAINYRLDRAVVFNLSGEPTEVLPRYFEVGCTLSVGRNVLAPDKIQFLFS